MNVFKFSFRIPFVFSFFCSLSIFSADFDEIRILGHLGTIKESLSSIKNSIEEKKRFLEMDQGKKSGAKSYQIADKSKLIISKEDIKFNLSVIRRILPELNRFIKPADQTQLLFVVSNFDVFLKECKKPKTFGKTEYEISSLEKMIEVMLNNSNRWIQDLERGMLEVSQFEGSPVRNRRQSFRRKSFRQSGLYPTIALADEAPHNLQYVSPQYPPLDSGYPEMLPHTTHGRKEPYSQLQPTVQPSSYFVQPSAPPPSHEPVKPNEMSRQALKRQDNILEERAIDSGPPQYNLDSHEKRSVSVHDRVARIDRRSQLLHQLAQPEGV